MLGVVALALPGCIVRDEMSTLSVRPDGSARLVLYHSNIRSTEEGTRGEAELRRYAGAFDTGQTEEVDRITMAGGCVEKADWVSREAPLATLIVAELPDAPALERYLSIEGEEGGLRLLTRYSADGLRRRLTASVRLPETLEVPDEASREPEQERQERADSISEKRLIVVGGRIVAAQGWIVASDRRSALFSVDAVTRLLREHPERLELFIEWEVDEPE